MNIFLFSFAILLVLGFFCALLIIGTTIISSRSVTRLAEKYPTIYAEEALAQAHHQTKLSQNDGTIAADSTQLLVP